MEQWKDINNYEGLYQVSNFGRIRSLKRETISSNQYSSFKKQANEIILKQSINKHGYCSIILSKNGKNKWYSVHRLVACAFIDNSNGFKCVNHKDENKQNNNVENLEWCTHKYNNNYGTRKKRVAKATSKQVIQYDINGDFIKIWSSIIEASINTNTNRHSITSCCKKQLKIAGGYRWEYVR